MGAGALVYVVLSRLFPHHASLIEDAVYAHEVLAARDAALGIGHVSSMEQDEEKKDDGARVEVLPTVV